MNRNFYFLIALLCTLYSYSQNGNYNLGARSSALAGASTTISDEYSLFNNIAGLGSIEHHSAFASYQNRYGISEFQVIGAGGVYHHDLFNAGVGFFRFGDDLFSEQRVHLAFSNKIQMVSLGIGVDILQYNISTIGASRAIAIQFGGIAEITPQMHFGAHIFNLNQAELEAETADRIPTVMKGGFSYRPSPELMINLEVEKDLDFDEVLKAGIEYQVIENVFIRTGISTEPFLGAFGIGFHPKNLKFDYSFSNDSRLGNIHEVSMAYSLK